MNRLKNGDVSDNDNQIAQITLMNECPIHSTQIHGGFLDLGFRY